MKSEEEVQAKIQQLKEIVWNSKTKKPARDEAFTWVFALEWVLRNDEDIIKKRLEEIGNARRD